MNVENGIKKLEDVVDEYIDKTTEIIRKEVSLFSCPGENNGGVLLKADLTLRKKKDYGSFGDENLSLIIKTIPPTEYFQILFNTQVSVKVEIAFYEVIVPTFSDFQRRLCGKTNDLFPKYYGGRISLDKSSDRVDNDSVIVLQNLQKEGYINVNRFQGCDMATTKMILENMAEFHAIPLAIKIKEKDLFEKKIKPYFSCYYPTSKIPTVPTSGMMDILCEKESFQSLYTKVKKSLLKIYEFTEEFREPFCTLVHKDLWVNNILVKYENTLPVNVKFIDFQKYSYDSPAKDLLYFLLTSVPLKFLRTHFDYFLKYYYDCFIEHLVILQCDTEPFSYEAFIKEVGLCIEEELGHALFMMLFVAYGKEGGPDTVNGKVIWDNKNYVPLEGREKFWWFIQICVDRRWI